MNIDKKVLLLNNSYEPIQIIGGKKAIIMLLLEKVDLIEKTNSFICSEKLKLSFPSVIKLKKYVSFNSLDVVLNRKNLLLRDHSSCQYCGSKSNLTIDHIIPKQKGGKDSWENLIIACSPCNSRKGNRSLIEAKMKLMKVPKKPNRFMYFNQYINQKNEGWKEYLFQNKN